MYDSDIDFERDIGDGFLPNFSITDLDIWNKLLLFLVRTGRVSFIGNDIISDGNKMENYLVKIGYRYNLLRHVLGENEIWGYAYNEPVTMEKLIEEIFDKRI